MPSNSSDVILRIIKRVRWWIAWSCGAAIVPIAATYVLPDVVPFPRLSDPERSIDVWCAWALGFALMGLAMWRLRGTPVRVLVTAQLIAGVAFAFAHAMPSIDTYAYLGYGDQLIHGANPWNPGIVPAADDISRAFMAVWGPSPSCRYGPAFVVFEAALVHVFGDSSIATLVIVQRLVSLLAAAGVTALVRGPNARFWALNPFVSYFYVFEAHNDVLFLFALALAARVRQPVLRGFLVGIGGSVKIVALAVLAWAKPSRAVATIASATLTLVVIYGLVPSALNGDGLGSQLGQVGNSIASLVASLASRQANLPLVELSVACGAVAIAFFLRWSKRDAVAFAVLLFIAALPVFWPWYLGWALLAGVASSHRTTLRFVVALCLCSLVIDLPYLGLFGYYMPVIWLFFVNSLCLLVVCGVVPRVFARPGSAGTVLWYARRLLLAAKRNWVRPLPLPPGT